MMGLLDWLFGASVSDEEIRRVGLAARAGQESAMQQLERMRSPFGSSLPPLGRLSRRKPRETHKTRMARLIARRQGRNAR